MPAAVGIEEEAPMTSEQVATLAERIANLVRRLDSFERALEREHAMERERQRERDERGDSWRAGIEQKLAKMDERVTAQERWKIYLLGAYGLAMLVVGLAPSWIGLVTR